MEKLHPKEKRELQNLVDEVAERLETEIENLARQAKKAFSEGSGREGKTQMSHLERTGLTARRFGDVVAFVKRQTGKEAGKKGNKRWSKPVAQVGDEKKSFGELMVDFLQRSKDMVDRRLEGTAVEDHKDKGRRMLMGICLRNLASAYLYNIRDEKDS